MEPSSHVSTASWEPPGAPPPDEPRIPNQRSAAIVSTTVVLPYVGSPASARTRPLRAWMLTLPADVVALVAPLLLTTQYWKATLCTAALTVAVFAAGGLYRGRRHLSILDELPSLCGRLLCSAAVVAIIVAQRHGSFP